MAIKTQALVDFLAEFTRRAPIHPRGEEFTSSHWNLFVDESFNRDGCGAALLLISPEGNECCYSLSFKFRTSNKEAEYEALIAGLNLASRLRARQIQVFSDSQLIVKQVQWEYEAKNDNMFKYLAEVKRLIEQFNSFQIQRVLRSENKRADALSKMASSSSNDLSRIVFVEVLAETSHKVRPIYPVHQQQTWMSTIQDFLDHGNLPTDPTQARKLKRIAPRYSIFNGVLYKRSYQGRWLKCITSEEGIHVLQDLHEGICGAHW